jgi:hypothetical protein
VTCDGFQDRRLKPLGHPSIKCANGIRARWERRLAAEVLTEVLRSAIPQKSLLASPPEAAKKKKNRAASEQTTMKPSLARALVTSP